jgi:uracil-DNA glycosylase
MTCLWNVVPGWNGTRKVSAEELRVGVGCLEGLFQLLPRLAVVVLVGTKAQRAQPLLVGRGIPTLTSYHPSPINRAAAPEKWHSIPREWARVQEYLWAEDSR